MKLDAFDKARNVKDIPKRRNADSPIRDKVLEFLGKFSVGNVKCIDCSDIKDAMRYVYHIKKSLDDVYPKFFVVAIRQGSVFVKRKEDIQNG